MGLQDPLISCLSYHKSLNSPESNRRALKSSEIFRFLKRSAVKRRTERRSQSLSNQYTIVKRNLYDQTKIIKMISKKIIKRSKKQRMIYQRLDQDKNGTLLSKEESNLQTIE
jgi:hypothetical protein